MNNFLFLKDQFPMYLVGRIWLRNENVCIIIGSDTLKAPWVLEQRRGEQEELYAVKKSLVFAFVEPIGTQSEPEFLINFAVKEDDILRKQVERMFKMDFSEANFPLGK